jgi:polysaccharide biosynthesis/export protein
MRRLTCLLLLLGGLILSGCAVDPAAEPYPDPPTRAGGNTPQATATGSYLLGVGDSVNISVWRFDDLKRTVMVDPAGNIQFPFAGEVRAAGLTPDQLRKALEAKLARYYVEPRVDIGMNQVRSPVVHVMGEVHTPGTLTLDKRLSVIEAISRSGGFNTEADDEMVFLIRDQDPEPKVYRLSLNLRSTQTSLDRNIILVSNDLVFVPPLGVVDVTRALTNIVGILNPLMSAGRAALIGDQLRQAFKGTSNNNLFVSP